MEKITGMNILHVTDAYAAGVMTALNQLVEMQIDAGNNVTMLLLERENFSPEFPTKKTNLEFTSFGRMNARSLFVLLVSTRSQIEDFDFVHLHSSRSGFLGRLVLIDKKDICQIYTPHGFSFLRQDINRLARNFYFALEAFVARISRATLVGVSHAEVALGKNLGVKKSLLLHNSINVPAGLSKKRPYAKKMNQLKVGFVGRNTPAKDPAFFLDLVEKCGPEVDFYWIGASREEFSDKPIPRNLQFFGFQNRDRALQILSDTDALIVTSLWEGLPTNIIEAQKIGIVVFLRDTLHIPELILHRETGFSFKTAEEFKSIILGSEFHESAMKISQKAKAQADLNFTSSKDNIEWMRVYTTAKLKTESENHD